MAQPQVIPGYPRRATTPRRGLPPATILTANGVAVTRGTPAASNRASQWIVQIVILATSAFAVLDLYLLATGFHH
jgi:hypothetical protein